MRDSAEPHYRKWLEDDGILSFEKGLRDKYGRKINENRIKNMNRSCKDCF